MNIFELRDRHTDTKTSFRTGEFTGKAGYQAQVYKHPRDPNRIIKTVDIGNPNADSYLDFIKLILEHQDNPHFPRIFSAKLYQKRPDEPDYDEAPYRLVVVMERLHEAFDNPKLEDAAAAALMNIGIPEKIAYAALRSSTVLYDYLEYNYEDLMNEEHTRLGKFIDAINELEPYVEEYGHDLHTANFMLRLTGTGPQIVLIDPLAPSSV